MFQKQQGHPILMVETFVEEERSIGLLLPTSRILYHFKV